ncbi:MAG: flavoprotein, partial [Thermoanaerobacterium sp.]|nr:flavoprotein [Thermoanaerobacterium sp.]
MAYTKNVVLGVTGGIAAYKSADLVSRLVKKDINVDVIMTESATKFISPLTFESLTH